MASVNSLLLGRDRRLFLQFLVAVVMITAFVPVVYAWYPERTQSGLVSLPTALALVMFVPAVIHAYLNDGLLPSLALGVIAGFEYNLYKFLFDVEAPYRADPHTLVDVFTSLQLPSVGLIHSLVGFVIGISIKYALGIFSGTAKS